MYAIIGENKIAYKGKRITDVNSLPLPILEALLKSKVIIKTKEDVKRNSKTGNSKTGNSKTGNPKTGNSKTGNSKTGNSKTGNSKTGNSKNE